MYDRLGNNIGLGTVVMDINAGFTFVLEQAKIVDYYACAVDVTVRYLDPANYLAARKFRVPDDDMRVLHWEVIGEIG